MLVVEIEFLRNRENLSHKYSTLKTSDLHSWPIVCTTQLVDNRHIWHLCKADMFYTPGGHFVNDPYLVLLQGLRILQKDAGISRTESFSPENRERAGDFAAKVLLVPIALPSIRSVKA